MKVEGKIAFVTGGAQGIGKAIATGLLTKGIKCVTIADVREKVGEATLAELASTYGKSRVRFQKCDVTAEEQVRSSFQKCFDEFQQLDIVCNCAGVAKLVDWRRTIHINLIGVISCSYAAIDLMKQQDKKEGVIVNVASIAALVPQFATPVYAATKMGVLGFTKCMAYLPDCVQNNIRMNTLCPWGVDTELYRNYHTSTQDDKKELISPFKCIPMEKVVTAFMMLVEDDSNVSTILTVTPRGIEKHELKSQLEAMNYYQETKA